LLQQLFKHYILMIRDINLTIVLILVIFSTYGYSLIDDNASYQIRENQASLRGKITDGNTQFLPGANLIVIGTEKGVNTNENGEYFMDKLQPGKHSIQASLIGFETQTIEILLEPGLNELNFSLEEQIVYLNPITVIAQKREKQILDVPAAISVVGTDFINKNNIVEISQLSEFVPGLLVVEQGANRPSYAIRGLTSEEISPSAQPRVSTYYNNVPINRASGASVALYDMDRVEVLKGPQNTLFGRGAQIGVVHFISKTPVSNTEGYLSAGVGNYNQREFRGAINVPIVKDKLFARLSGLYDYRDGYVENTFGGNLMGKNTKAGRFSMRYIPVEKHKLDLVLSYQKDDTPGVAFMSKQFPNSVGDTSIFNYRASLEQGKNLNTGKEIFDASLYYKYFINENNYLSTITSYRKVNSSSRWDGDGTAAPAIDMWDEAGADQFYQEIRYNYSIDSRLIGSTGISYWHENADQTYWFSPNEQSMAVLFFNPEYLILPNGQPLLIPALPDDPSLGPLAGMPLPSEHEENNVSAANNQAAEVFLDLTYRMTNKLSFTGGLRGAYENFELKNEASLTGGEPSTLGMLTGNYPNLFFMPSEEKSQSSEGFSFNWQVGAQYKINERTNTFINYSNGRRPIVLQYTSIGTPEAIPAEWVDNIDAGIKTNISDKVFFDGVAFFQKYNDFQTRAWIADPETGEFNYKTINGGKATSYGVETSVNALIVKGLMLFGNYAYLHGTFDDTNKNGQEQEYAGNSFRLSPKHTFALGLNGEMNFTPKVKGFITPSYTYKSQIFFEDANTEGLEQSGYGLFNINLGVELTDPHLILNFFGTNLLDEEYIISAGNTGSLFGVPTFVPGAPRMFGTKLTWMF